MGKHERVEKCTGYVIKISIIDETNKCEALYPMSSDEKFNHLKEFIKAKKYSIISIDALNGVFENSSTLKYNIILSEFSNVASMLEDCQNLGINFDKLMYYYKKKEWSDEDYDAQMALEDAKIKAQFYCKGIGLKLKGIKLIDDLTSISANNSGNQLNFYNNYNTQLYNFGRSRSFWQDQIWYVEERSTAYQLKVVFDVE